MSLSSFNFYSLIHGLSVLVAPTAGSLGMLFMLALGIVFINAFLLVAFGLVGAAFLRRMRMDSSELEQELREAHEKAKELLEAARQESLHMVAEAGRKAGELLQQTGSAKEQIETQLDQEIRQFSEHERARVAEFSVQLMDAYRGMLGMTQQQYGAAIAATAKEMADMSQAALKQFEEDLKEQTIRYQGALKVQVQESFMSAQKEISDYRRESLRKVEDEIYRILNLVTKSVIGKALDLEDQQELVVHALNEAKQQSFFEI